MPTIFTKIIKGEIPSYKILEDEKFLAFLDIRPISPGHTLVIPKQEIDYIFDLDDEAISGFFCFAKKVARLIQKVVEKRIGIIVAGIEVPHAHIHLVPFTKISDLNFANAKPASSDELLAMAERIRKTAEESNNST